MSHFKASNWGLKFEFKNSPIQNYLFKKLFLGLQFSAIIIICHETVTSIKWSFEVQNYPKVNFEIHIFSSISLQHNLFTTRHNKDSNFQSDSNSSQFLGNLKTENIKECKKNNREQHDANSRF